jgi:hypothetical protein
LRGELRGVRQDSPFKHPSKSILIPWVFVHPQRVKDKIFSFYTIWHQAFEFFLVNTTMLLNREFNNKESLVLAAWWFIEIGDNTRQYFQNRLHNKTNRHDMPLLNIGGITATFNSFNAAFIFLSKECEEDYVWPWCFPRGCRQ